MTEGQNYGGVSKKASTLTKRTTAVILSKRYSMSVVTTMTEGQNYDRVSKKVNMLSTRITIDII